METSAKDYHYYHRRYNRRHHQTLMIRGEKQSHLKGFLFRVKLLAGCPRTLRILSNIQRSVCKKISAKIVHEDDDNGDDAVYEYRKASEKQYR